MSELHLYKITDPSLDIDIILNRLYKIIGFSLDQIKEIIIEQINDSTGQIYNYNQQKIIEILLYSDSNEMIKTNITMNYGNLLIIFYINKYSSNNDDL